MSDHPKTRIIKNVIARDAIEVYASAVDLAIIKQGVQYSDASIVAVRPQDLPELIRYLTEVQAEIEDRRISPKNKS